MKNLLLFLALTFTTIICNGQIRQLPDYLIEGGDTIGIVLSIEQVQKLDNNTELLQLFKQLQIDCDNLEGYYVSIINECNQQIALLEASNSSLTEQGSKKDELILNQETRLNNFSKDSLLVSKELQNKDEEIKLLKKDLTKEKLKKWISAGFNALQAAALVYIIIKL